MRLVADLHIHSHFSLATSPKLTPASLDRWARIKGINLLGTGDCTHPTWLAELRERLEPAEEGFFRLKSEAKRDFDIGEALADDLPSPSQDVAESGADPRFVLSGEISTIYSRDGRTRKVHHLVLLPDFAAAAAFQARLERRGNISSDGRPILGIDSRDLFAMLLEADERSILVPAHIWTPWFSALGARSGFDSIDECYGDLAPRIGAVETGLSSNPPMNWAVSALDRFSIISNSDAHSPEKLGREATVIDIEPSFAGLAEALGGGGSRGRILETIEFFPQEGKYHYDGHRSCGVALSPEESARYEGLCPVCGRPLTPGVLRRVTELADRPVDESAACPEDYAGTNRRPYTSLIPLKELLAELLGVGEGSKKVGAAYGALVEGAGSEFALLLEQSAPKLEALGRGGVSGELLALAVGRMRSGRVSITPGYDGEYGVVRAFAPGESFEPRRETGLFDEKESAGSPTVPSGDPKAQPLLDAAYPRGAAPSGGRRGKGPRPPGATAMDESPAPELKGTFQLDAAQEAALRHSGGPALILAGPGTGKTAVLALRVAALVEGGLDPSSILALTFTNKAAQELRGRISRSLDPERAEAIWAGTFHSFCRSLLREHYAEASLSADFAILDEVERTAVLEAIAASSASARRIGTYIEEHKRFLLLPGERNPRFGPGAPGGLAELAAELGLPQFDGQMDSAYGAYREALRATGALDFDDLIAGAVRLCAARPELVRDYLRRFRAIFVDEYQDVNFAQYAMVRILAPSASAELCAIGDPNQAIYGFRGSDRRFIDRFLADYPGAAVYRLVRSFRCAPSIVGAAGRLVGTELEGTGSAVALSRTEFPTDKSEAEGIAREIDRLIGGTRFFAYDSGVVDSAAEATRSAASMSPGLRSLGECAILFRAAALSPPIQKALLDHGIPYRLVGETPWWEEEPCRSVVALLRAAGQPALAEPRPRDSAAPESALRARLSGLSPEAAVRVAFALLDQARPSKKSGRKTEAAPVAVPDSLSERLAARAASYRDLRTFLDDLALASPQDGYEAHSETVSLMTIHAAKGLEFDHVFVAGLEEGILPFTLFEERSGQNEDAAHLEERLEEERRLLYVAMTRARIGLHLSWARSRHFRGRALSLQPSRFLAQIEELVPLLDAGPRRPRDPQMGLF